MLFQMLCHTAQAEVRTVHPHAEGILPYLLYSDGACVRLGGETSHVLNIISAAGSIGETRSRRGYAHIALIPVVSRKHLGLPKKLSSADQETCAPCSLCLAVCSAHVVHWGLILWTVMQAKEECTPAPRHPREVLKLLRVAPRPAAAATSEERLLWLHILSLLAHSCDAPVCCAD